MLRWQTAGESHGEALVAMIEGLPAGVRISTDDIVSALARRRLGYGRGARMKFEQDKVRLLTGVRHGLTLSLIHISKAPKKRAGGRPIWRRGCKQRVKTVILRSIRFRRYH